MTAHTLRRGDTQIQVGFRPHDMGVTVTLGDRTYHPEWRLVSELQTSRDRSGPPEFWASDRHRVYFDKPADQDYQVSAEQG
jgi:hypothetical protein